MLVPPTIDLIKARKGRKLRPPSLFPDMPAAYYPNPKQPDPTWQENAAKRIPAGVRQGNYKGGQFTPSQAGSLFGQGGPTLFDAAEKKPEPEAGPTPTPAGSGGKTVTLTDLTGRTNKGNTPFHVPAGTVVIPDPARKGRITARTADMILANGEHGSHWVEGPEDAFGPHPGAKPQDTPAATQPPAAPAPSPSAPAPRMDPLTGQGGLFDEDAGKPPRAREEVEPENVDMDVSRLHEMADTRSRREPRLRHGVEEDGHHHFFGADAHVMSDLTGVPVVHARGMHGDTVPMVRIPDDVYQEASRKLPPNMRPHESLKASDQDIPEKWHVTADEINEYRDLLNYPGRTDEERVESEKRRNQIAHDVGRRIYALKHGEAMAKQQEENPHSMKMKTGHSARFVDAFRDATQSAIHSRLTDEDIVREIGRAGGEVRDADGKRIELKKAIDGQPGLPAPPAVKRPAADVYKDIRRATGADVVFIGGTGRPHLRGEHRGETRTIPIPDEHIEAMTNQHPGAAGNLHTWFRSALRAEKAVQIDLIKAKRPAKPQGQMGFDFNAPAPPAGKVTPAAPSVTNSAPAVPQAEMRPAASTPAPKFTGPQGSLFSTVPVGLPAKVDPVRAGERQEQHAARPVSEPEKPKSSLRPERPPVPHTAGDERHTVSDEEWKDVDAHLDEMDRRRGHNQPAPGSQATQAAESQGPMELHNRHPLAASHSGTVASKLKRTKDDYNTGTIYASDVTGPAISGDYHGRNSDLWRELESGRAKRLPIAKNDVRGQYERVKLSDGRVFGLHPWVIDQMQGPRKDTTIGEEHPSEFADTLSDLDRHGALRGYSAAQGLSRWAFDPKQRAELAGDETHASMLRAEHERRLGVVRPHIAKWADWHRANRDQVENQFRGYQEDVRPPDPDELASSWGIKPGETHKQGGPEGVNAALGDLRRLGPRETGPTDGEKASAAPQISLVTPASQAGGGRDLELQMPGAEAAAGQKKKMDSVPRTDRFLGKQSRNPMTRDKFKEAHPDIPEEQHPKWFEGDRVAMKDGRHGTITKVEPWRMQSIYGGQPSEWNYHYVATPDGGGPQYLTSDEVEKLQPAVGEPEAVYPDIARTLSGKTHLFHPNDVQRELRSYVRGYQEAERKLSRARTPHTRQGHRNAMDAEKKSYDRVRREWDDWAEAYPHAAERYGGVPEWPQPEPAQERPAREPMSVPREGAAAEPTHDDWAQGADHDLDEHGQRVLTHRGGIYAIGPVPGEADKWQILTHQRDGGGKTWKPNKKPRQRFVGSREDAMREAERRFKKIQEKDDGGGRRGSKKYDSGRTGDLEAMHGETTEGRDYEDYLPPWERAIQIDLIKAVVRPPTSGPHSGVPGKPTGNPAADDALADWGVARAPHHALWVLPDGQAINGLMRGHADDAVPVLHWDMKRYVDRYHRRTPEDDHIEQYPKIAHGLGDGQTPAVRMSLRPPGHRGHLLASIFGPMTDAQRSYLHRAIASKGDDLDGVAVDIYHPQTKMWRTSVDNVNHPGISHGSVIRQASEAMDALHNEPADLNKAIQSASEGRPIMEPHQLWHKPPSEFVDLESTFPKHDAAELAAMGPYHDGSEQAAHEYTIRSRALNQKPPTFPKHPVGTFAIDRDGDVWQLQEHKFDSPDFHLREGMPVNDTSRKYAEWIKQGHEPPPGRGFEDETGKVHLQDGHHRASALHQAGHDGMKVWVSLTHNKTLPNGVIHPQPYNHRAAMEDAVQRGHMTADEYRKHYPEAFEPHPHKRIIADDVAGRLDNQYERVRGREARGEKDDARSLLERRAKLLGRWVSSGMFHRMMVPLDQIGHTDVAPGAKSHTEGPIIVDQNVSGEGNPARWYDHRGMPKQGRPPVMVLDGKHRVADARRRGITHLPAYVGDKAIPHLMGGTDRGE